MQASNAQLSPPVKSKSHRKCSKISSIDFWQESRSNKRKYIPRAKSEPSDNLTKNLRVLKFQEYIEENYPLGALAESSKFRSLSKPPEFDTAVTKTTYTQMTTYHSILASSITPNKKAAVEAWLDKVHIDIGAFEDLNEKSLRSGAIQVEKLTVERINRVD